MKVYKWSNLSESQKEKLLKSFRGISLIPQTGRWIITEDMPCFGYIQEYLTCSVCGAKYNGTGVSTEWNYCPNCGTKMDMERE